MIHVCMSLSDYYQFYFVSVELYKYIFFLHFQYVTCMIQ